MRMFEYLMGEKSDQTVDDPTEAVEGSVGVKNDTVQHEDYVPVFAMDSKLEEYLEFSRTCVPHILKREDEETSPLKWEFMKSSHGIGLWKARVEGSSWYALKSQGKMKASAELVAELLNDPDRMAEFDLMIDGCTVVNVISNAEMKAQLRHVKAKPVLITLPREFLAITTREELDDGRIVIATRSVDYEPIPESKGYVRATMHFSGYIVKPLTNNTCEVTMLAHTDLAGSLPAKIITFLGTSVPVKLLETIRTIVEAEQAEVENMK